MSHRRVLDPSALLDKSGRAGRRGTRMRKPAGRTCNVSGACHWTMNVAASNGHGKLYADCYSVSPCGVFVAPESPVKTPADLAGVRSVGYQSGSHYATIQGFEQYLKLDQIKLSFNDGLLFSRMELLIARKVPAASLFSGPYYFLEQLGFRKVIDTTFMMASMITGTPDPEDVRKYFRALRRAQRDIDLRPSFTRTTTRRSSRRASMTRWIRGAGARVSGSYSSRTRSRHSMNRSSGSSNMASSRAAKWAAGNTKARSSQKLPNRRFSAHGRKTPLPGSHQTTLM